MLDPKLLTSALLTRTLLRMKCTYSGSGQEFQAGYNDCLRFLPEMNSGNRC